jgi:alpha-ketoglutarate-dependent taurine dioxygenase
MIEVRRLGPQIGVEIQGVDVKTLDDASFAVIYRAWLDSNVLIEELEEREGDEMIEELTGRMIQPEAEYRHKWRKGDIVIWDNRCSYHRAAGDYPPEEDRIHWRVSIKEHAAAGRVATN